MKKHGNEILLVCAITCEQDIQLEFQYLKLI
jgi:hypothetical protein